MKHDSIGVTVSSGDCDLSSQGSIKSRFSKLDTSRAALVDRCRECSKLTIPSLLPPEGHTESDPLSTPYQSLGARAVNNLSSKLLLTVLPPNSPCFRLKIDQVVLNELEAQAEALGSPSPKGKIETSLATMEQIIVDFIEQKGFRVAMWKALRLLVVTGNALIYLPEESNRLKVYPVDKYVVLRDGVGQVLEIISKEAVHPTALNEELKAGLASEIQDLGMDENLEIYTRVRKISEDEFEADQEIAGKLLSELTGKKPKKYKGNEMRWIALRWTQTDSDHYGRGHIEEYLGDFYSLEGLTQNVLEATAIMSLLIWMVNPNGVTDTLDLERADNGSFVSGNAQDIEALQTDKSQDLSIAANTIHDITDRLEQAFLLHSSVQRNAERVTAEEIRYMAQELEDALGGIYSILAAELQLPLINLIISILSQEHKLPSFGDEEIKPIITTGLEALSRGHDLNKMMQLLEVAKALGEGGLGAVNAVGFLERAGSNLGVDTKGIIKTQKELQQEQDQAKQEELMKTVAPQLTQGIIGAQQGAA